MAVWRRMATLGGLRIGLTLLWAAPLAQAQLGDKVGEEQLSQGTWNAPPSPPLPPQLALKSLRIDPEFRVELVAMTFDPDGSLWVAEMRAFMPQLDAREDDENAPRGRIDVRRDDDGDGHCEYVEHFAEGLPSPSTLALTRGRLLVNDGVALP